MSVNTDDILTQMLTSVDLLQAQVNLLRDNVMALVRMSEPEKDQGKRLPVLWVGQNTPRPDDDFTNNDCGAACLAMLVNYIGRAATVDDVSKATGKTRGYKILSFEDVIAAAIKFKIVLQHATLTVQEICAEIDSGRPCIVLVNYMSIPLYSRYDARYNAGHYLLVVGYDAECIIYHDPYWPSADKGAFKAMTRAEFARAYTTTAPGNQYASHALRML